MNDAKILIGAKEEELKRMMLLQVRVKGILESLVNNTSTDTTPIPLIIFMDNLTQKGAYVPNAFLSKYQLNRIDTDNYGAIIDLDEVQLKCIIGTYLFARIMVMSIFLSVKSDGGQDRVNEVVEENFKIVGSVLYYLFKQVMDTLTEGYARVPDEPGNDIYSKKVMKYREVARFFDGSKNKPFNETMRKHISDWLERVYLLVSNAEKIKEKQERQID